MQSAPTGGVFLWPYYSEKNSPISRLPAVLLLGRASKKRYNVAEPINLYEVLIMTEKQIAIVEALRGGLIVSCQAQPDEPLHSSYIMSRMAYAAMLGGAVGIRSESFDDICAIRKTVDLPIIGLIKAPGEHTEDDVYITATTQEVDLVAQAGADICAMDATCRPRPDGRTLQETFTLARAAHPELLFMADCSTYEECMAAAEMGFDFVGTTMRSYTAYTRGISIPDYDLLTRLAKECPAKVIAEGGIWSPEALRRAMDCGIHTCVVGSAITRPMLITQHYVNALKKG